MSKTPFSSKCQILGELWLYYREDANNDEAWGQFFSWADVALPLSYMVWQNLAVLNPDDPSEGTQYIEDAWTTFCEMISIDPNSKYTSLGDCWDASPNSPLISVVKMEM